MPRRRIRNTVHARYLGVRRMGLGIAFAGIMMAIGLIAPASGPRADGPQDNIPEKVRPVPPPGIEVPASDRAEMEAPLAALGGEIDSLRESLKGKPLAELLP